MRKLRLLCSSVVVFGSLLSPVQAATEISVLYGLPNLFKDTHEQLVKDFEVANPDIKVRLLAPAKHYDEVASAVFKSAITGEIPDVVYNGTNLMNQFVDRKLAVPLDKFISSDPTFSAEGYIPAMLGTSKVNGIQYGLPFAISTPIAYYNVDLLAKAGWDVNKLPSTWSEVIKASQMVNSLGSDVTGMFIHWQIGGSYIWQSLLADYGGSLLDKNGVTIGFNNKSGLASLELLRDFSTKAKMPNYTREQGRQAFTSGQVAMQFSSSAELTLVTRQVGSKFTLRTGPFPSNRADAPIVSGGATAMMLTKDPSKQKAAWRYMRYVTGAQGQTTMVKSTGYNPSSKVAIDSPAYLAGYYAENVNARTSLDQLSRAAPWLSFPGPNAIKASDVVMKKLESVVSLTETPEAALSSMTAETSKLIK